MEKFALVSVILNLLLTGSNIVTLVTLRSQRAKAHEEAKSLALDNDKKVSDMVNEYFVEPLKKEITALRREMLRLRKAIERIPECPHAAECPVKESLKESEELKVES